MLCLMMPRTRAQMPDVVVFPGSAAEIAAMVRLANEHRFPVVPRGAGTGRSGGAVPIEGGVVLVLTRLNRILEINTGTTWWRWWSPGSSWGG